MTVPTVWELTARHFENKQIFASPGDLAKAIEPTTIQTPALDLIDQHLAMVERGEIDRLAINMSPQEGKSSRVTTMGPLWMLAKDPSRRIAIVSYAQDLADQFGRNIRNQITGNQGEDGSLDLGMRIAPDNGAARRWKLDGERGGVKSVGISTGLTGHAVDALFIDDPISNLEQANSKTWRDRVWNFWQAVGNTRLAPGAPVILVMTRWHADDLQGRLLAAEDADRWTVLNIPAEAIDENDPLGRKPGVWMESARGRTPEQWQAIKRAVGPKVWQSLYMGIPTLDDGGVFPTEWERYDEPLWQVNDRGEHTILGMERDDQELTMSFDLAFKGDDSSDYVVGQVWLRIGNIVYLLDQVRRRMNFNETLESFRTMRAKWPQCRTVLVEDRANGPAVMNALHREMSGLIPVEPRGSKFSRASAVAPAVWSKHVKIPSTRLCPWIEEFMQEVLSFPHGANDDQVDAATQALDQLIMQPIDGLGEIIEPDEYDEPPISYW
ncbi:phage terminase large subunit [Nesterenkonia jeotgali]|uniref:Terminase large subunit gp17-like C-terminal domain-containing protein n=1 Tax=Nesterenkonia jeotgali TaxID=317018 RepID=A0A0W8IGL5_9MICC|nr:phage terminase large subunit [Nesterenkonia jeotgali]KUG58971.1 hypothetical protein AVL63_02820 [Nesterenkonia jeotgali]